MNLEITPDPAFKKKAFLEFTVVALLIILPIEMIHLILYLSNDDPVLKVFVILDLIVLIILYGISLPLRIWWINNLFYRISPDRITITKGILSRIEVNIPFKMVTDFKLTRSPFDRILKIGSILAQTAGQGSAVPEGLMQGLRDYRTIHDGLKKRLAEYEHHVSEGKEAGSDRTLSDLYGELVQIRKLLEKQNR